MRKKHRTYDSDFKQQLVLMSYGSKSTVSLEKEFDLNRGLLTVWRQKHEQSGNGNFTAEHFLKLRRKNEKMQELEKKIKHADDKFMILKGASLYQDKGTRALLSFIKKNEKTYSITLMCEVLSVNRSFYHRWRRNIPNKTQMRKKICQQKIIEAFFNAEKRYGAWRITAVLQQEGFKISIGTVKKYMNELGLKGIVKKRF